tara:strand:- start:96 stop:1301 length:1206 start_codon:yes stop_codon:yes gene_type:complete
MGNLFNSLNKLKSNIFGGPGNTGFTKPPATRVAKLGIEDTPTSLLSVDPLAFASFSYPKDITNNVQNGHYMLFYVNVQNRSKFNYNNPDGKQHDATFQKRVPDGVDEDGKPKSKVVDFKGEGKAIQAYNRKRANKITGAYTTGMDNIVDGSARRKDRAIGGGVAAKSKTTRRISDSVAIYLPPNVQDSVGATYNDMQTGMLGYAAAAALDFSGAVGAKDYESAAAALTGGIGGIMTEAAKKSAAALAETLAGAEGGAQLVNRAFGQADNPFMEVLFESMEVRTFTYNFTFAPRNEEETADVQSIIQLFRFHMSPELQGAQSRFLTLPSEFDIHYMYMAKDGTNSENDYYNKISTCVLTNCTVDYTPGAVRSFADGAPTQITMGLTFKETETLTKDKINEGF